MLHYALVFFVIAIIAAVFGFTGIAAGAAEASPKAAVGGFPHEKQRTPECGYAICSLR